MPDIVVFKLVAPMATFGDLAVGERRGTHVRPSHSAMTGLVASALGMPRDAPGHEALAAGFHLAIRTDAAGAPLADFHTAQTPPQRRGRSFATRKEELADKNDLGTIISRRDYLTDVAFTVLLWPTDAPAHAAQAIADALNRPAFALYAGRRSCPLGAPVAAKVVQAESLAEAFGTYDERTKAHHELATKLRPRGQPGDIVFDAALRDVCGDRLAVLREEVRRDRLISRARWQFAPRSECVARLIAAPQASAEGQGGSP